MYMRVTGRESRLSRVPLLSNQAATLKAQIPRQASNLKETPSMDRLGKYSVHRASLLVGQCPQGTPFTRQRFQRLSKERESSSAIALVRHLFAIHMHTAATHQHTCLRRCCCVLGPNMRSALRCCCVLANRPHRDHRQGVKSGDLVALLPGGEIRVSNCNGRWLSCCMSRA
jgi:hypothetical protein